MEGIIGAAIGALSLVLATWLNNREAGRGAGIIGPKP